MSKLIMTFSALCFLLASCNVDEPIKDSKNNCEQNVILSEELFNQTAGNAIHVLDISYNGECISIELGYSGCNDGHNIDLVTDGQVAESNPPQLTLAFYDHDLQDCEAYFTETFEYGLGDLAVFQAYETLVLKFKNSDKAFTLEP